ncbi:hypothetical protein KDAU_61550 [Dictyobacter aurantiacus]|uniref:HAMP domain-containing protein n=1 Tax=Dictyobacter aurantiacus TaxID=1936993 RepID=A0A401ZPY8_9CHLR|nr:hypothetical protein KDAU_61550 [Dictyobacter aurantiacus]
MLSWWYRLVEPKDSITLAQNDPLHRTRVASILLLMSLLTCIAFIPAGLSSQNYHVLPPVLGLLAVTFVAIFLNRQGKVQVLGALIAIAVNATLIAVLLTYPKFELPQNAMPIYDLFVLSVIIAVSFLPGPGVVLTTLFNCLFITIDMIFQPHTADLQNTLTTTNYTILLRPLAIQIIVALVTYIWVRNANRAIEKANQAELIAQLERDMAQQKRDLDIGIQQLLQTLVEAANGNLNVRAPYTQENVLWQVGSAVNMLVSRLQRTTLNEQELTRIKDELRRVIQSVRESKRNHNNFYLMPGGTDMDPLISELLGCNLSQPTYPPSPSPLNRRELKN